MNCISQKATKKYSINEADHIIRAALSQLDDISATEKKEMADAIGAYTLGLCIPFNEFANDQELINDFFDWFINE